MSKNKFLWVSAKLEMARSAPNRSQGKDREKAQKPRKESI